MTNYLLKLIFLIFVTLNLSAQQKYSDTLFRPPVDITMYLSGTFGELRSNHFHSGIDIRTNEVEGHNIYAIADGFISRIKVSSGGYGNALYITHPSGYVSVYGHLQKYNESIGEYVINEQYRRESFELDLYPSKNLLPVKKGEIIAISGNSGRSGGPHLHFEIRDAGTQKPINPLLFGFAVADNTPPVINLLKVYPANSHSMINGSQLPQDFYPIYKSARYSIKNNDTLTVSGQAYFGINTYDPFNNGNNKNGVYEIKLYQNDLLVYEHSVETFSFDETRYINSLIDYKEYKQKKRQVQKTWVQPNNHLSIYQKSLNSGILSFDIDQVYKMTYEVSDVVENKAILTFYIKAKSMLPDLIPDYESKHAPLFTYKKTNIFENDKIHLEVPGSALYDTLYFKYKMAEPMAKAYSDIHQIHFDYVPLHTRCNFSIKADSVPMNLREKALIAKIDGDGEFCSAGGTWENGYIKTRIREFGNYCIVVDTVNPEIKPINISNGKDISAQTSLKVKIKDDLSGIQSYRGTLNGKWILMQYDAKNDLLKYYYDDMLQEGENEFKLVIIDYKGNSSTYSAKLKYTKK